MPQAISGTQIQQLINGINSATDAAGKQSAIESTYSLLSFMGYDYAGWAGGVASQKTWTGIAAMDFLTNTAMMKSMGSVSNTATLNFN